MINYTSHKNLKFVKFFESFIFESYTKKSIILRPGDLGNLDEECMEGGGDPLMCDLVKDVVSYGVDKSVKRMNKILSLKWPGVETIHDDNFWIYRGVSFKKGTESYEKFYNIYESKSKEKGSQGTFDDFTNYGYKTYTSWTMNQNIAKSYADTRKGDIKVMFREKVKNLKTFANLFEVGDESEELIIYPFSDRRIEYKIWKN